MENIEQTKPKINKVDMPNGWRFYHVDDAIYPSVTTIIDVASNDDTKSFLLNITKAAFSKIMEHTASTGELIHKCIEDFCNKVDFTIPEKAKGGFETYLKIHEKHKIEPLMQEKFVYSKNYGYAGTMDMVANVDGELMVVELKTGKFQRKHELQVAAYRRAAIEMGLVKEESRTCLIYAHRDGKQAAFYTHKQLDFLFESFLCALMLHQQQNPGEYRKFEWKQKWKNPFETYYGIKHPQPEDFKKGEEK